MSRKPLIAGNWKMHGSLAGSRVLVDGLVAGVDHDGADMLVCPPAPYISAVRQWIGEAPIRLGAQDLAEHPGQGAFTGEVAGEMLADVGCSHVIVGHSERRSLYGEIDAVVAAKFRAAQAAGLIPILCVGETLEQREAGDTQAVVARQVDAVLDAADSTAFAGAVIAYEPVWAIGTGQTATPEQAQEVHAAIRGLVAARDVTIAADVLILYGGSMKPANAGELLDMPDIDGGLVGGASLDAAQFLAIFCAAAGQTN
ncbi:MAG TPA: triose-phosphate isomerase [Gammaproteobacteria bacterium]|nr:triose-phosphate isomerase [Gammaproteobacteria bacterium]